LVRRIVTAFEKRELLLLTAILTMATVLRVGWPGLTEFKFSEARLAALALELTHEGHVPLVGVPSSAGLDHSPISVYLYAPAFLFITSVLPATVYGGLVGVAAVALCWWLARRWPGGGRWAAWVAALLFAVSPWAVTFSRKIWQVTFVPLLTLVFIGLVISALVRGAGTSVSKGRHWHLAGALVVFAVLVQVHPSALSLAPALLLWLIVFWHRVRLGPLLVGGAVGSLTAVPFLLHQSQNGWPALTALQSLSAATWDPSSVRLAWEAITGRSIHALAGDAYPLLQTVPYLDRVFSLTGWLTLAASIWLFWRIATSWRAGDAYRQEAAQVDLVLLSWLAIPVVLNLRHSLDLYLHFFSLIVPAAYLVIGRAAEALFGASRAERPLQQQVTPRTRLLGFIGTAGLGLLALTQVVALVLMARFVSTHDTSGGFGTPLMRYLSVGAEAIAAATSGNAAEILVVGQGDSTAVDEMPAIFDVILRDETAYRFVDGESAAIFPPHRAVVLLTPEPGMAAKWYDQWPAQELQGAYRLVMLDGSWPKDLLNPVVGPRLFENGIEFQGYQWEPELEKQTVSGNQGNLPSGLARGRFWLLWQVLWETPSDTHFATRLLGAEGQLLGQQDSDGYPTAYRRRGDRVISEFDISVNAEGTADPVRAEARLYFFPEVVTVPVIDEAGRAVADVVTMGPLRGGW
jgi:hypothetical protein